MHPTFAHGKICYLVIPAIEINQSATFYKMVFNWTLRHNDEGIISFDDAAGEVSGIWVTGLTPFTNGNTLSIHLMVFDMAQALKDIESNGGKIVKAPDYEAKEITAQFADPSGNVFGLYWHRG